MNMQKNLKVEDEVFQIASELVRRFSNKETHECNFAMERAEFMNDDDFIYELPETPQFLERNNLADILSDDSAIVTPSFWIHYGMGRYSIYQPEINEKRKFNFNCLSSRKINVRGFYLVAFNIEAIINWYENELNLKIGKIKSVEKIPKGWKWFDELHGIYQFGAFGRVEQDRGDIGKIFRVAMNLFEETPQAISITALSERTGIEKKVIRTRLGEINKKLRKLGLNLVGGGGYYRIKSTQNNEN